MKIEFQQRQRVEKAINHVIIAIPADEVERDDVYGDCTGKMPVSFKNVAKDMYVLYVDPNGVVRDWPAGITVDAYFKPSDGGRYWIVFDDDVSIRIGCYVPSCLSMGDGGGDYLELKIDGTGRIADWERVFTPLCVAREIEESP